MKLSHQLVYNLSAGVTMCFSPVKLVFSDFKVKLDNFFGLTLSLWFITWLNSVIVVEKWNHSLLNWSPISPVCTMVFSLSPWRGFCGKILNQWRSLYSLSWWLVYAAHLSNRWHWYKLNSSPCSASPRRVSASHTVSRLKLELRWTSLHCCNFPCSRLVSVQTGLKKERGSINEIKCEPAQMAAADLLPNESHATAIVNGLKKLSTATLSIKIQQTWGQTIRIYFFKRSESTIRQYRREKA